MTNEEIQKHIETNCRNEHEEPMMDEQAFYEGAKWARDQMNSSNDIQNVMICRNCGSKNTYKCRVTDVIVCKDCDYQD